MFGLKLTPETIILLPIALCLDLAGIILACFALDDLFILDLAGMVSIGTWLLLKKGDSSVMKQGKRGRQSKMKKLFTNKKYRFFITTGGELIPYLGAFPFWTVSTYFNLSK
jgi:hypothetical protein